MKFNQPEDENTVKQRIAQRFRQVDDALKDQAQQESSMVGMGTTLTVAFSLGSTLLIGHVGDSRAYVMRGNTLHRWRTIIRWPRRWLMRVSLTQVMPQLGLFIMY
jgi:serine/threonine protein phosphatase PrpC